MKGLKSEITFFNIIYTLFNIIIFNYNTQKFHAALNTESKRIYERVKVQTPLENTIFPRSQYCPFSKTIDCLNNV